jgi:hypothetical protein
MFRKIRYTFWYQNHAFLNKFEPYLIRRMKYHIS